MVPILGARTEEQLRDNLGALEVKLSDAHLARLHEVSRIELGFPHEFLAAEGVRDTISGGTWKQVDNHRRI
jgi:diketogulonate reductase-like aldo/keto reductase